MVQFNPFDDSFMKHKIGSAGNIGAPSKIDEANKPSENQQGAQGGTIEKSDENDYVDTTDMIDDSADFSSSDFSEDDNSSQIDSTNKGTESSDSNNENSGKESKEEIMEEASQLMENFFDKKELTN